MAARVHKPSSLSNAIISNTFTSTVSSRKEEEQGAPREGDDDPVHFLANLIQQGSLQHAIEVLQQPYWTPNKINVSILDDKAPCEINRPTSDGMLLLTVALRAKSLCYFFFCLLLEKGADPEAVGADGRKVDWWFEEGIEQDDCRKEWKKSVVAKRKGEAYTMPPGLAEQIDIEAKKQLHVRKLIRNAAVFITEPSGWIAPAPAPSKRSNSAVSNSPDLEEQQPVAAPVAKKAKVVAPPPSLPPLPPLPPLPVASGSGSGPRSALKEEERDELEEDRAAGKPKVHESVKKPTKAPKPQASYPQPVKRPRRPHIIRPLPLASPPEVEDPAASVSPVASTSTLDNSAPQPQLYYHPRSGSGPPKPKPLPIRYDPNLPLPSLIPPRNTHHVSPYKPEIVPIDQDATLELSASGKIYTPSNLKAFACTNEGCEKRFKNMNGLKYHRKHGKCSNSGLDRGGKGAGKPFVCHDETCGKRYKNKNGLRYHYENSGAHGVVGNELLISNTHPAPQYDYGYEYAEGDEFYSDENEGEMNPETMQQ